MNQNQDLRRLGEMRGLGQISEEEDEIAGAELLSEVSGAPLISPPSAGPVQTDGPALGGTNAPGFGWWPLLSQL